jgi:hypothetical protein
VDLEREWRDFLRGWIGKIRRRVVHKLEPLVVGVRTARNPRNVSGSNTTKFGAGAMRARESAAEICYKFAPRPFTLQT